MHGPRAKGLPKGAVFPGENVMDDVHGTAQAVWDVRRVIAWIRAQQPDARIGLNGISLGGYIAALVASLDDGLTCAILGVPPSNLVELLGRHSGLAKDDPRRMTIELARPIGRMVSPLSMQPKVPPQGRFIYAGVADRIVHPRQQVIQLWSTGGAPISAGTTAATPGFSRPVRSSSTSTRHWCTQGCPTPCPTIPPSRRVHQKGDRRWNPLRSSVGPLVM
jgi:hypothetical protein